AALHLGSAFRPQASLRTSEQRLCYHREPPPYGNSPGFHLPVGHLRHLLPGGSTGRGARVDSHALQCGPRSHEPLRAGSAETLKTPRKKPREHRAHINMNSEPAQQRKSKHTTWAIPLAYVFTTLAVGMLFPRVEHYLMPNLVSTMSAAAGMG